MLKSELAAMRKAHSKADVDRCVVVVWSVPSGFLVLALDEIPPDNGILFATVFPQPE